MLRYPPPVQVGRRARCLSTWRFLRKGCVRDGRQRQLEPEGSSATRHTLDTNLSVLPAHQLAANIETQPKTFFPATLNRCARRLVKAFPDAPLLLRRKAWSMILHLNT